MSDGNLTGVYVHPQGLCESSVVGRGTRVWAFAHVLKGAVIGEDCNICDNVFIENDVTLGDRVTVKCGVQIWDGAKIGNDVFIGPNATFTNDRFPRSKQYPDSFLTTTIEDGASIGANATLLPGLTIGRQAMVGAGAVVTKSVPPNAIVVGNPALIVGYQTKGTPIQESRSDISPGLQRKKLAVGGCELWQLPRFSDLRGQLAPLEFDQNLPFIPKRSFLVFGVPTAEVRGEHAHRACHQFLIAAHHKLSVVLDDGHQRVEVELGDPSAGLWIPPMVWGIQYKFDPDTVLLVLASRQYEPNDYIRNYDEFLADSRASFGKG